MERLPTVERTKTATDTATVCRASLSRTGSLYGDDRRQSGATRTEVLAPPQAWVASTDVLRPGRRPPSLQAP